MKNWNCNRAGEWLKANPGKTLIDSDGDVWAYDGVHGFRYGRGEAGSPRHTADLLDGGWGVMVTFLPPTDPPFVREADNAPPPPLKDTNPKTAFGATKPSLALIPTSALLHEALAFENGAAKYGAYNWRENAVSAMTYINAALRHVGDYLDGAHDAADSGVHNLAHARACLAILIDAEECRMLVDDRPKPGQSEALSLRLQAWKKERAREKA